MLTGGTSEIAKTAATPGLEPVIIAREGDFSTTEPFDHTFGGVESDEEPTAACGTKKEIVHVWPSRWGTKGFTETPVAKLRIVYTTMHRICPVFVRAGYY